MQIVPAFFIVLRNADFSWCLMRIGLVFNQRPDGFDDHLESSGRQSTPPSPLDAFVEWDEPETIGAVEEALRVFGEVVRLEAIDDFPSRLAGAGVDLIFNMAEGTRGPSREAHVPAIAEFLGIPYTASEPLTLAIALHKGRTKDALSQRGVPTPPFVLLESTNDLSALVSFAHYPLFLKPAWEGSSKGIGQENLCRSPEQAMAFAEVLMQTYEQPVIAESYLPGEEFSAAILGNGLEAECLPIIRYRFDGLPRGALPIMGREAKWIWDRPERPLEVLECPARVSRPLRERISQLALAAYRALGCRDWARVDLRLDADGRPQVLEVNPLPGIIPDPAANSCFPLAAARAGISYPELIQRVVQLAWHRVTGQRSMSTTFAGAAT